MRSRYLQLAETSPKWTVSCDHLIVVLTTPLGENQILFLDVAKLYLQINCKGRNFLVLICVLRAALLTVQLSAG